MFKQIRIHTCIRYIYCKYYCSFNFKFNINFKIDKIFV